MSQDNGHVKLDQGSTSASDRSRKLYRLLPGFALLQCFFAKEPVSSCCRSRLTVSCDLLSAFASWPCRLIRQTQGSTKAYDQPQLIISHVIAAEQSCH